VGKLETRGIEIDGIALISDNFMVSFGVAAIDASIKSFTGADCFAHQATLAPAGCVEVAPGVKAQDLSGKELANSPDLKVNIGGDLTVPMEASSFDGFVNFSYQWQDEVNFDLLQSPLSVQDAYGIFNLSVGIAAKDESYRLTLFANNLFDQDFVTSIGGSNFYTNPTQVQMVPRGAERYLGLRLKYNF
jgi:iron complex outermembrane receptor protein